jgi:hypothetical protein
VTVTEGLRAARHPIRRFGPKVGTMLIAALGAVIVATVLAGTALASWVTTTTKSQSYQGGTVTLTASSSTAVTGLTPKSGTSAVGYSEVINASNTALGDLQFKVNDGSNFSVDTLFASATTVTVDYCTTANGYAWAAPGTGTPTCTTWTSIGSASLSSLNSAGVDVSTTIAAAAKIGVRYTYTLSNAAQDPNTPQVLTGTARNLTWTFKASTGATPGSQWWNTTTAAQAVTVPTAVVPEAPTAVSCAAASTNATVGSLSYSFTAPYNGGSVVTKYQYTTDAGATWADLAGTASPQVISAQSDTETLLNGFTYSNVVAVRAVNTKGSGASSATVTAVSTVGLPEAPQELVAAAGNTQASLSWYEPTTYLSLPRVSGNYASTPDSAANSITSDIDVRVNVALTNWTAAANQALVSKYTGAGTRSYLFEITTTGRLLVYHVASGDTANSYQSTVATGFTNSQAGWVRYTWRQSDGRIQFFTSLDGSTWTQLGADVTGPTVAMVDSTAPVQIGQYGASGDVAGGNVYRAQVCNSITVCAGSNLVADFYPSTQQPTPTNANATFSGGGTPTESWTVTMGASGSTRARIVSATGGSAITNHTVAASPNPGSSPVTTGSASASYTYAGLVNGTAYTFTVASTNAQGTGPASPSATTTPYTTPGTPTLNTLTPGNQQLTAAFTAPGSTSGSAITNYYYSTDNGTTWKARTDAGGTSTSMAITVESGTVNALANGTTYTVKIAAYNTGSPGGMGTGSNMVSEYPNTTPGAPTLTTTQSDTLSGTADAGGRLSVAFTAPGSTGGSAITSYEYTTNAGVTWTALAGTSSPQVISGLTNGTSYTVAIHAVNRSGNGTSSGSLAAAPYTYPGAPTSPTATNGVANQLTVNWTAPVSNGGFALDLYTATATGVGGPFTCTAVQAATTCTLTGLTGGASYNVTVTSRNTAPITGLTAGPLTSAVSSLATPNPSIPCAVPNAPGVTSISPGNLQLSVAFTPATHNGCAVTMYQYTTDNGVTWRNRIDAGTTGTPLLITKLSADGVTTLTNGTSYSVMIRAVNSIGNGASSTMTNVAPYTSPSITALSVASSNTASTGGQLTFTFTTTTGGNTITACQYTTDAGATWATFGGITSTQVATTQSDTQPLLNGYTYPAASVQMKCTNASGYGSAFQSTTAGTPVGLPDTPQGPSVTPGNTQATVNWFEPATYLQAPGMSGSYASTLNSATLQATGDLLLRAWVAPASWTPTSTQVLVAKNSSSAAANVSYGLGINTSGTLYFQQAVASTITTVNSSAATGFGSGVGEWVEATRTGVTVAFYTSTDGATWSQLGTTQTGAAGTLNTNTGPLEIGSQHGGTANLFTGKIYRAQVCNSITVCTGSNLIADFNPTSQQATPTNANATFSGGGTPTESWTVTMGASGANRARIVTAIGGSSITNFSTRYSTDNGSTWSGGTATGSTSATKTVMSLTNDTTYLFQVAATDAQGTSGWSTSTLRATPYVVADAAVWFDANWGGFTLSGSDVTTWVPKTNGGQSLARSNTGVGSTVYSATALNSKPGVAFNGTNTLTGTTGLDYSSGSVTVFAVGQMTTTEGTGRVVSGASNNWLLGWYGRGQDLMYSAGWVSQPNPTRSADTPAKVYTAVQTAGTSSVLYRNGAQIASNGIYLAGPNGISIGGYNSAEQSSSKFSELIIYNRALSAGERSSVEAYLESKYSITAAVPSVPSSNVSCTSGGTTSFDCYWDAPADNGQPITGHEYQVATSTAGLTSATVQSSGSTNAYVTPTTIDGTTALSANTIYYFRVRAVNASGSGAWSANIGPVRGAYSTWIATATDMSMSTYAGAGSLRWPMYAGLGRKPIDDTNGFAGAAGYGAYGLFAWASDNSTTLRVCPGGNATSYVGGSNGGATSGTTNGGGGGGRIDVRTTATSCGSSATVAQTYFAAAGGGGGGYAFGSAGAYGVFFGGSGGGNNPASGGDGYTGCYGTFCGSGLLGEGGKHGTSSAGGGGGTSTYCTGTWSTCALGSSGAVFSGGAGGNNSGSGGGGLYGGGGAADAYETTYLTQAGGGGGQGSTALGTAGSSGVLLGSTTNGSTGASSVTLGWGDANVGTTYPPTGVSDSVTAQTSIGSVTRVNLAGWTVDYDTSRPLTLHVYEDGAAGVGTFVGASTANTFRSDIQTAFRLGNNHGYNVTLYGRTAGSHSYYVYAINANGGSTNTLLGSATVTVTS